MLISNENGKKLICFHLIIILNDKTYDKSKSSMEVTLNEFYCIFDFSL